MYINVSRSWYYSDDCQKIVKHSGAMTLTEKVYTHFDIEEFVETHKKDIPDSSENVLYISISLLYTCCICVAFNVNSSTSDNFPQPL